MVNSKRCLISFRCAWFAALFIALTVLSGCSGEKTVNFKINSVPKGAHVLYQVVGGSNSCQGQWIYLGSTPVQGVRKFEERELENTDKIILKIMHSGYFDQTKEWDGPGFWEEIEEREVIFWTPELVPAPMDEQ